MKHIGISQRVDTVENGEKRNALDEKWSSFLWECGYLPICLPNVPEIASKLIADLKIEGVVLSGGNDLVACGGDAPQRDETEKAIIEHAMKTHMPVIGVCRGMQAIQNHFGVGLKRVKGQVQEVQDVLIRGVKTSVNSYHCWGTKENRRPLKVWAEGTDGIIKAISHETLPIHGVMWHPERFQPFTDRDKAFFQEVFGKST